MPPDRSSDKVRFDVKNEDQFRDRAARPARPGGRPSPAPPTRKRASRCRPEWPTRVRLHAAVDAGAGRAARGLARDRGRGIRATGGGGIPGQPARRRDPGRGGRPVGTSSRARPVPDPDRLRLRTRSPGCRPVPAGHLDAIRAPGAQRGAKRAARVPRRTRHARVADRPRRLPQPGPRDGCPSGAHRHLLRVRPGPQARRHRFARGRRPAGRDRGTVPGGGARRPPLRRPRRHRDPRRRATACASTCSTRPTSMPSS